MIEANQYVLPRRRSCSGVALTSILEGDSWDYEAMNTPNSAWNPRFMDGVWAIPTTDNAIDIFMFYLETTRMFPRDELKAVRELVTTMVKRPWESNTFYKVFEIKKKSGGTRTIEAPMELLKKVQRAILHTWIYGTDGPHSCVQGFVPKRGINTNAQRHFVEDDARVRILLKQDLRDFFPSISRLQLLSSMLDNRNHMLHTGHGWKVPPVLRELLKGPRFNEWLKANAHESKYSYTRLSVPLATDIQQWLKTYLCISRYRDWESHQDPKHVLVEMTAAMIDYVVSYVCSLDDRLPQGSPCSPALANVFMRKFNANIIHLVNTLNTKNPEFNLEYSIYADDLCATGSIMKGIRTFKGITESCIHDYPDISPNPEKTGIFKPGQTQCVTGCQITDRVSISRQRRDEVRAMLYMVAKGYKKPTEQEIMQLKGLRAWIIGIDPMGWQRRCEKLYQACGFPESKGKKGKKAVKFLKKQKTAWDDE